MAKAKQAFTVKYLDSIKPTGKRQEIPDPGLKGGYFIVQPSGAKSFAVRHAGKPKYTIGSYPRPVGLADYTKLATAALRAYSEGRDPQAEKKAAKAEEASGDDLFENDIAEFVKRHVQKKNRKSTEKDQQRFIDNELLKRWKGRRTDAITKRDVVKMLNEIVDRGAPQSAVRVLALVRKFFNWCVGAGKLDASPCTGIPAPAPITKRKRVLSFDELRLVWLAAEQIGWPFGPMVKLLMLTGARREEVAAATWREFDLKAKQPVWVIPEDRAKNSTEHHVALAPTALAILEGLPRIVGKGNFILTTNGETSISGYSRGKARLDAAMLAIARKEAEERGDDPDEVSIPDWTLHDLRRSLATRGGDIGILPHIVEALLNHAKTGIAAHYNHARYEAEKRAALIRWAAHIEGTVAEKPSASIIPMRRPQAKLADA
jgi:integrase